MANFLKLGYTMLNIACPVCNNPVFRDKNGETLCPICNRKVLLVNHESPKKRKNNQNQMIQNKDNNEMCNNTEIFQNLKHVATLRVKELTNQLESENDLDLIEKLIGLLTHIANLINEINKLL